MNRIFMDTNGNMAWDTGEPIGETTRFIIANGTTPEVNIVLE